jgi:hypothetical protein
MSRWVLGQPDKRQRSYVSVLHWQDLPQDWLAQQEEVIRALGREDLADGEQVWPIGASWNQDLQDWSRVRFAPEQGGKQLREELALD